MRKKLILGGMILAMLCLLSGCAAIEPEDRTFPMLIGVDYQDNKFQFIYGVPQMALVTGQDKGEENAGADSQIRLYEGETPEAARMKYDLSQDKYLDLGHVKVLVLGTDLLAQLDKRITLLKYLAGNPVLAGNIYVFQTEQMKELMALNKTQIDSLGDYLTGMVENKPQNDRKQVPQLQDLYNAWYNEEAFPGLPQIYVEEDVIYLD